MNDDRRRRLLGIELKLLGHFDVYSGRIEQLEYFRLVFEVWTGRIAKAVARALISLVKEFHKFCGIRTSDAELFADSFVPHFGQGLGRFYRQTVKDKIVGIVVGFEQLCRVLACLSTNCHKVERYD